MSRREVSCVTFCDSALLFLEAGHSREGPLIIEQVVLTYEICQKILFAIEAYLVPAVDSTIKHQSNNSIF